MTSTTWEHRLDSAQSVDEVLGAARDFLARLDPQEIDGLPSKCRPPAKLVDPDDIGMYAFDLVRYECDDHEVAELVHRLARFFSQASMHVARMMALERATRAAQRSAYEERAEAAATQKARVAGQ
jgi:hypothetical protein